MRRIAVLLCALAATAVAAPVAFGGVQTSVRVVDLPVSGGRILAASGPEPRFTLVGVHWRGSGRVLFRTRSLGGVWSAWKPAAPEDEDAPDRRSPEMRQRTGWRVGNPWWVGPSDRVQVRAVGRASRVRVYLVWSPAIRVPLRAPAATVTPPIVSRVMWGADESIRRGQPTYAPVLRFAVVHHTAGRNDYTRADAAAIVRGIQLYHVQGNGWNDIGYNFLVDRFGTVYEGRYGGVDRNVVGAHAQGFNTGSTGIALLGTYGDAAPSRAAQDALAGLLAWRLDVAHVDPLGMLTVLSGGNDRFVSGVPVLLRAVSGHRDTGFTECPGDALYARLSSLATSAAQIGQPKIFEPRVEGSPGGPLRFRARLSSPLTWGAAVTDGAGNEIAHGEGPGPSVDWTWDSSLVPSGTYEWTITAGDARPAVGSLRIGSPTAPLAIEGAVAEPKAITPNGDGQADVALLTYSLTTAANVTVQVSDETGAVVATVLDRIWTQAGQQALVLDGSRLADGRYSIVIHARTAAGAEVQTAVPLEVSRTLGTVSVAPDIFSPNGDGRRDRLEIRFSLAAPAEVKVRILRDGRWIATPLSGTLFAGPHRLVWDGSKRYGRLRDGVYSASVEAQDAVGAVSYAVPFVADTLAPRVRILPGRPLRVEVSEPAVLTVRVDGAPLRMEAKRAGVVRIPWTGPAKRVRVVAWDAAGNASEPAVRAVRAGS